MLSRETIRGSIKNVGGGNWFGNSKTPPWGDHGAEEFLPCLPHPSHDSQLSRLAIAITIPVTHAAKTENSRRSLRRKAILAPPSASPCRTHPDTPWDCPWSDTRHRGQQFAGDLECAPRAGQD